MVTIWTNELAIRHNPLVTIVGNIDTIRHGIVRFVI